MIFGASPLASASIAGGPFVITITVPTTVDGSPSYGGGGYSVTASMHRRGIKRHYSDGSIKTAAPIDLYDPATNSLAMLNIAKILITSGVLECL